MYIELFLIDNFLYNYLILKLSSVICTKKAVLWRVIVLSVFGALFSLFAFLYPVFMSLPFKILFGSILGTAFKFTNIKDYFYSVGAVFLSTFIAGGMTVAAIFILGGQIDQGYIMAPLPVRIALIAFAICCTLPNLTRRLLSRRKAGNVTICFTYQEKEYKLNGIIDSGNMLCDPITALPVILISIPHIDIEHAIPIPITTANGDSFVFAFKPKELKCNGMDTEALIAPSTTKLKYTEALVPGCIAADF